ncbi:hypothetical protein NL676_024525 [Syzygium grande]|nr:hypothetical protein NL676_024525 [Syzygium grande]
MEKSRAALATRSGQPNRAVIASGSKVLTTPPTPPERAPHVWARTRGGVGSEGGERKNSATSTTKPVELPGEGKKGSCTAGGCANQGLVRDFGERGRLRLSPVNLPRIRGEVHRSAMHRRRGSAVGRPLKRKERTRDSLISSSRIGVGEARPLSVRRA